MIIIVTTITVLFILFIFILFNIFHTTHLDMTRKQILNSTQIKHTFKEFKKDFYNQKWIRDPHFKYSFFDIHENFMKFENYIHASIVIVNNTKYLFTKMSYLKYMWFITKNKTTEKNKDKIVNNIKEIRLIKLKRLNKIK